MTLAQLRNRAGCLPSAQHPALQDSELVINGKKCVWGVPELDYLGHKISIADVLPLPSPVPRGRHPGVPCTSLIKQLQSFLGMVNFYRRFLPSPASADTHRQAEQRQEGAGAAGVVSDDGHCFRSSRFKHCCPPLAWPTPSNPTVGAALSLEVDTLAMQLCACLKQQLRGRKDWQPLGFFSKKLEAAGRHQTFPLYAGWTPFHCLHGPQAAHLRPVKYLRPMDCTPMQAAFLCGRVYIRHLPHRRCSQCNGRFPLQAARTCDGRGASLSRDLCKSARGSQVAALQGGRKKFTSSK